MNRSSYAGHRRVSKRKGKRPVKGLDFDAAPTLQSDSVRGRFGNQQCQHWWLPNVPSRFPCPLSATPCQGPSLGDTPGIGQTGAHPHYATLSARRNKTQHRYQAALLSDPTLCRAAPRLASAPWLLHHDPKCPRPGETVGVSRTRGSTTGLKDTVPEKR